ncbi:chorismate-binding protein, partial [Micrococcus luteus]|nr:chorismate-binding protein [Micrococcus luteus]
MLKAAFPCGSITGAPKHMSMQLIEALEQRPRGIYTGSIGLLEANPEASKAAGELSFYGQLNVMIRSFHLQEADGYYQAAMGVGSGIV